MFSYYVYEKPGKESYGTVERYHTGKGIGILLAEVLLIIFNLLFFGTDTGSRTKGAAKKVKKRAKKAMVFLRSLHGWRWSVFS